MAPPIGRAAPAAVVQNPDSGADVEKDAIAFAGLNFSGLAGGNAGVRVGIETGNAALGMELQLGTSWDKKMTIGVDLRIRPAQFDVFDGTLSPTIRAGLLAVGTVKTQTVVSAGLGLEYTNSEKLRLGFDVGPGYAPQTTDAKSSLQPVVANVYVGTVF
jgi:hypothetical protein